MPVLAPALPLPPVAAAPAAVTETAPSADSEGTFEAVLSTALEGSETGGGEALADSGGQYPPPEPVPTIEVLAASGNTLPPELPPEAVAALDLAALLQVLPAAPGQPVMDDADTDAISLVDGTTSPKLLAQETATPFSAWRRVPLNTAPVLTAAVLPPAGEHGATAPALPLPASALNAAVPTEAVLKEVALKEVVLKTETTTDNGRPNAIDNLSRFAAVETGATPAPGFSTVFNNTAAAPLAATVAAIPVPVGHATWGQALSQQVVWSVQQQQSTAELHLSPPELGPVRVRLSVEADQATISFAAAHGSVREAIEAALPRLRDMLAQQGIVLAEANVTGQEGFQQARREAGERSGERGAGPGRETEAAADAPRVVRNLRLLDTYA